MIKNHLPTLALSLYFLFQAQAFAFAPGQDILAQKDDGKWAAAGAAAGFIQTFEQSSLYPLQKLPVSQKSIRSLAFSPDSQSLASCEDGGQISIYQTGQWKLLQRKQLPVNCETLAYSKQGVLALAGYSFQKT
jgi:hypothetical protein